MGGWTVDQLLALPLSYYEALCRMVDEDEKARERHRP